MVASLILAALYLEQPRLVYLSQNTGRIYVLNVSFQF